MDLLAPAPGPLLRQETPEDWAPYGDPGTCPVTDGFTRPQATAGWNTGKTISDLWSYEDSSGVWVLVDGVGWKRLSPASDSGHTHMTLLAGLATHDNLPVDFHEDDQGQIDQLIV
jgi:hypothetical protein